MPLRAHAAAASSTDSDPSTGGPMSRAGSAPVPEHDPDRADAHPSIKTPSARARRGGTAVVFDLVLIGLAIALDPLPLTAFLIVLPSERGVRKARHSCSAG